MASKSVKKVIYGQKLFKYLKRHSQILIVGADNVDANQLQSIRQGLKGDAVVLMGKNTMMKRSVSIHAPATEKNAFVGTVPHIVGRVGLVFTDREPEEVAEAVEKYNLRPLFCSSMDIGLLSTLEESFSDHLILAYR